MEQEKTDHRKIYAKGWYDGMAAARAGVASLQEGGKMRLSVMENKLKNASSTERKIWDAIPIEEAWSIKEICTVLGRNGVTSIQLHTVEWAVRTLKDNGLVVEPKPGHFKRVHYNPRSQESPEPMPAPSPTTIQQKISDFSARLRKFADEVEIFGLEIEDMIESSAQENKKLVELKNLIKSLGD